MFEIYSKHSGIIYGTFDGRGRAESFLMTMENPWWYGIRPQTKGITVDPITGKETHTHE